MSDKIEVTRADWEYLRALMDTPPFWHNDQAWKVKAQLLFNHFGARYRQLGREEGARIMQERAALAVTCGDCGTRAFEQIIADSIRDLDPAQVVKGATP